MIKPIRGVAVVGCVVLLLSAVAFVRAATPSSGNAPPLHGVFAQPDAMRQFYRALNVGLVAVIEHAYQPMKRAFVHNTNPDGEAVTGLEGLRKGTAVMIWSVSDEERMTTEGRVTLIDRARGRITVTCDDGTIDVLQLTEHRGASMWSDEEQAIAAEAIGAQAAVSYNDESGRRRVHFFRWVDERH